MRNSFEAREDVPPASSLAHERACAIYLFSLSGVSRAPARARTFSVRNFSADTKTQRRKSRELRVDRQEAKENKKSSIKRQIKLADLRAKNNCVDSLGALEVLKWGRLEASSH